jgi:hypothetical protein
MYNQIDLFDDAIARRYDAVIQLWGQCRDDCGMDDNRKVLVDIVFAHYLSLWDSKLTVGEMRDILFH